MAIKGSLSQFYPGSDSGGSTSTSMFGGFKERRQKEAEGRKQDAKLSSYKEGFYKIEDPASRFSIIQGLKKRAQSGDELAKQRYQSIVGDSRLPQEVSDTAGVPQLNPLEKVVRGGAEFGKDLATPFRVIGQGSARALGAGRETPGQAAATRSLDTTQTRILQVLRDPNVPQARKDILLNALNDTAREQVQQAASQTQLIESQTDKSRFTGALAEAGSYFAGGGSLAKAAKAGRGALVKTAGATAGSGAVGGAGFTAVRDENASLGDVAKGAAIGGVLGLGGSAALTGAGQAVRKVKNLDVHVPPLSETRLGSKVAQNKTAQKIGALKDEFVAKVIDDTNFIKKPFKGATDSNTGRKITDEIEDRVTNIRQFSGLAQNRLQENKAYQELVPLIGGDKKKAKEFADFISTKQNAVNTRKLADSPVTVAKNRLNAANEALDRATNPRQQAAAKTRIKHATKQWEDAQAQYSKKSLPGVPKGTPEQEKAYELLNQATKDDIQYLFDNGRITKEKYDQWIDDPDYTRVQREVLADQQSIGKAGLTPKVKGVTEQKLKGSNKKAIDPFVAYEDWQRNITLEVEKNNLAKYLRDQSVARGIGDKVDTTSAGYERIKQLYGEEGIKQETLGVFENGLRDLYTVDPRAAKQLAKSSDLELKAISNWLLAPSRILRGGATSLNAAFAVPNFIRDQVSSAIVSQNARATHNPIVFYQGLKEAIAKPTARATVGKIPGLQNAFKPSPMFEEYLKRNANMTSVDLARNLKDAARLSQENLGLKGETLLRRYENIISASEKATRYQSFLGTYKDAIKKGVDPEQAIQRANAAARRNSVNFSNRGELSTFMKIFNPYFNAGVQGSKTLAGAIKNRPVATGLKIGATILMPVAASTYHNLSDPDRAEIYARIPEYERKANLIMVLGGNRGYIKVPLPPGIREFANPLRNLVESEYLGDRQGFLTTAKDLLVDPFSPVGTTGSELLSQAIPQAVKPVVELGLNKDLYSGRDIIPENLQNLPKEEQSFDSTPQIYKDIGKKLGMSPLQVRKLVTGYGASGAEGALTTPDAVLGRNTGNRSTLEQIRSRFAAPNPKEDSNQVTSTFYKTYTPLKGQKASVSKKITAAVQDGDIDKANSLANELNDDIEREKTRLRETYGKFETDLSVLYDQFDSLKIPTENGQLKESSIKSRLKQKK